MLSNKQSAYTPVEEEGSGLLHQQEQGVSAQKKIWAGIAGVAMMVLVLGGHAAYQQTTPLNPNQLSLAEVDTCSLVECFAAGCDHSLSPILCVSGNAAWGCFNEKEIEGMGDVCEEFCDLTDCAHAKADVEDLPRTCDDCDEEYCASPLAHNCDYNAPYVCKAGSAAYGCAASEYTYAAAPYTTCSACCNTRACM